MKQSVWEQSQSKHNKGFDTSNISDISDISDISHHGYSMLQQPATKVVQTGNPEATVVDGLGGGPSEARRSPEIHGVSLLSHGYNDL